MTTSRFGEAWESAAQRERMYSALQSIRDDEQRHREIAESFARSQELADRISSAARFWFWVAAVVVLASVVAWCCR